MITEICGMIRNAQDNNSAGVLNYARLLADNLDKAGQHTEATRILRTLGEQTIQSATAALDAIAICHTGQVCHHQPKGCPTACEKAMGFNPFAPIANAVSFDFTIAPQASK